MIILIDNYDSFTFNIYHYFGEIGAKVEVIRNDKKTSEEIISMKPKALIFSPGPCTPNEAGISLDLIVKSKSIFPMLGICLGHQSIGQAFGSNIVQCKEIMHGKVDTLSHNNHELFKNIENNTETNFLKNRVNKTKMVNIRSKFNQFAFHLSNPLTTFFRNIFLKRLVKNKKFLESYLGKIYR